MSEPAGHMHFISMRMVNKRPDAQPRTSEEGADK